MFLVFIYSYIVDSVICIKVKVVIYVGILLECLVKLFMKYYVKKSEIKFLYRMIFGILYNRKYIVMLIIDIDIDYFV